VYKKAQVIIGESRAKTGDEALAYEDFMLLSVKMNALFFPTNLLH